MLALEVQVDFSDVLANLKEKRATVADLSKLIELVRRHKRDIPDDVKSIILSIPHLVLREKCDLKDAVAVWANTNGTYFSGNCPGLGNWKQKFESGSFDLHDMNDFMGFILGHSSRLNSDFYLRNPEVTLRDDVCLKDPKSFQNEQVVYAMVLENALMK